uniref:Transient receptor potential cation channel protein painless-like n=1 Tax=Diabrotica virgifera virgifera TaxID=50390 RepID=A0A6P7GLG9_DIAVI
MYSKINNGDKSTIFTRTNSICPPPEGVLLDRVLTNETDQLETIVNEKLLKYLYPDHSKPILLIACTAKEVEARTVKLLIDLGADVRYQDENQWEALHYAAERADYFVLKVIIDKLKERKFHLNEVLAQGSNALHILIRHGNKNSKDFVKCAKLLIDEGINVNLADNKMMTPILWAAKKDLNDIIKVILDYSRVSVDIDSHNSRGRTARDLITAGNLYDGSLPDKGDNNNLNGIPLKEISPKGADSLFELIRLNQENDFLNCDSEMIGDLVNSENGNQTLLQLACKVGNKRIVKHLLEKGADKNKTTSSKKETPLEITAEYGFHEIFEILINKYENDDQIPQSVLPILLKNYDSPKFPEINWKLCCDHFLKKIKYNRNLYDINGRDASGNTPLHYAIRYGDTVIINKLLDVGASLGSKNNFGFMPVQDLEPELLEAHLDNCVQFDLKGKKEKEDFTITLNYRTLVPPAKEILNPDAEVGRNSGNKELVHETEVISYMSTAPEFKHLLMHPVIVSFLYMKWHRTRWLFFTNLAFYVAFCASLVIYIFSYYANFVDELSSFQTFLKHFSWIILLITFFVLMFRELFQIFVLPKKYFTNFENYMEIILIILAGSILFIGSPSINTRKQLSSLSILLAAFELILMIGQHPKLSTNVVMLRTVSYNFFKFLLWYSLLLIAFALSFYILFTEGSKQPSANNTEGGDEDSFADPGKSVFKTIVMLTGEFEASDMNFETFPIVSKLIFVMFIFMIAIILLNLLNGLAVSDTQMIKNDAELLGHIYRAQHIRYVEVMLLGNIVPKNIFNKFNDFCCCFPFGQNLQYSIFKPLAQKICLFPHFLNYEMTVYPNKSGRIYKPIGKDQACAAWCNTTNLDKETVRRINELVQAKKEQMKINPDPDKLKQEIFMIKNKLEDLLRNFNSIVGSQKDSNYQN